MSTNDLEPRTDAPLDPEPYIVNKMGGSFRTNDPEDFGNVAFRPRFGFEQDQARYPRTDATEPGDER